MKVTANGIEVHHEIEGDGPIVTMSHSVGCHLAMWNEQARALRSRYLDKASGRHKR